MNLRMYAVERNGEGESTFKVVVTNQIVFVKRTRPDNEIISMYFIWDGKSFQMFQNSEPMKSLHFNYRTFYSQLSIYTEIHLLKTAATTYAEQLTFASSKANSFTFSNTLLSASVKSRLGSSPSATNIFG